MLPVLVVDQNQLPRKGTETLSIWCDCMTQFMKDDQNQLPRKGTETPVPFVVFIISLVLIKTNFPVRGRKHGQLSIQSFLSMLDQNQLPRKGTETISINPFFILHRHRIKTNFPVRGRKLSYSTASIPSSPRIKTNFPVRGRKHLAFTANFAQPADQNQLPRKGTETLSMTGASDGLIPRSKPTSP